MAQQKVIIRTFVKNTDGTTDWVLKPVAVTVAEFNTATRYVVLVQEPEKILTNVWILQKDSKLKNELGSLILTSIINPKRIIDLANPTLASQIQELRVNQPNFSPDGLVSGVTAADINVSFSRFDDPYGAIRDEREIVDSNGGELKREFLSNDKVYTLEFYIKQLDPLGEDTSTLDSNFIIYKKATFDRTRNVPKPKQASKRSIGSGGISKKDKDAINAAVKNSFNAEDQGLLLMHLPKFDTVRNSKASALLANQAYKNLIRVDIDNADENTYFVNKLFNPPDLNKFMAASPLLLTALTPKIRIYKVIPKTTPTKEANQKSLIGAENDTKNNSFSFLVPFEEYLSVQNNINSDEAINNFLIEYGKSFGSGLKSININDSSSPLTPLNVTANFKLTFSSFDKLFNVHVIPSEENPDVTTQFRFKDLLQKDVAIADPADGTNMEHQDPVSFKIRLVIGWSFDEKVLRRINYGSTDLTIDEINAIKSTLQRSETVYYLGSKDYSVAVEENGKVNIEVNYLSAIQQLFGSKDISVLYRTNSEGYAETYQDIIRNTAQLNKLKNSLDKIESDGREKASKATGGKFTSVDKVLEDTFKKEREKILNDMAQNKWIMHKNFLDNLYKNSKIYKVKIKKEDIDALKKAVTNKELIKDSANLTLQLQNIIKNSNLEITPVLSSEKEELLKKSQSEVLSKNAKKEELETLNSSLETKLSKSKIIDPKADKEINFIYLGDILDYVFGALKSQKSVEYRQCIPIIGNFSHFEYKEKDKPVKTEVDGQEVNLKLEMTARVPMNYCDLPISLERFKKFLFDEFVRPQVQAMKLEDFLNRLITKIVMESTDANIFGEQIKMSFGRVMTGQSTMRVVSINGVEKEYLTDTPYEEILDRKVMIKRIRLSDIRRNRINSDSMNKNTKVFNYFYLFSQASDNLISKILDSGDRNQYGVVNIDISSNRGLVKKVAFSKVQGLHLAESAFLSGRVRPGTEPMFLAGVSNAEIEMIGNTFFKAGSIVYIDPSYMLKNPSADRTEIKRFGAGGYYNVTKISHEITPGKFVTKASSVFNHSDDIGKSPSTEAVPAPQNIGGSIEMNLGNIEQERQKLEKERNSIQNKSSGA